MTHSLSPYDKFCAGYGNPGTKGTGYYLGYNLGVGKVESLLSHEGSKVLDETIAFDSAEVDEAYLGQTNMITVSSFCGPHGRLWGYDVVKPESGLQPHPLIKEGIVSRDGASVAIYSAEPLMRATKSLFGTKEERKFPIYPGSHLPCAIKSIMKEGPALLYCVLGVGVPKDRAGSACLMMEDVGYLPHNLDEKSVHTAKSQLLSAVGKSVLEVGANQKVEYKKVLAEVKTIHIGKGEIGCALIAAPYFSLAQDAVPENGEDELVSMSLEQWINSVE